MRVVKRLHLFLLKSFLPLFAMTFFIVLFIVLMQFLWRYIDDLVGKGLSIDVIGELFFYAAVSMVPMALPLAILLASLMTFGNLGERFELTAMKAAGISLLRVMAPLIVFISGIAVGAFYFQNDVLPKAQVKMWTLLFSMRQKSPEVEIPTGVFYDQIPGINLHVGRKNKETGMLYDVKIYDVRHGGENVTILVSDSAHMALTSDMQYILLHMYRGNQYEKMAPNSNMRNDPFRRESYEMKEILIPFDNNFTRLDESGMKSQYVGKNIDELQATIDSLDVKLDSLGVQNAALIANQTFPTLDLPSAEKMAVGNIHYAGVPTQQKKETDAKKEKAAPVEISFDSLMQSLSPSTHNAVLAAAIRDTEQRRNSMMYESETVAQEKKVMRRHEIELLKKFTLSVACVIFFFIGAPLGAIIRKGGIGMPLVISVFLFLIYYIFDNTGYKMARDGHSEVWFGMWLSTMILAPLGIFVTYKAMRDSTLFDPDKIRIVFRKMLGRKDKRNIALKEVVINDVESEEVIARLRKIEVESSSLRKALRRKYFFLGKKSRNKTRELVAEVESLIEYMRDTHSAKVIEILNAYPQIRPSRLTRAGKIKRYVKTVARLDGRLLDAEGLDEKYREYVERETLEASALPFPQEIPDWGSRLLEYSLTKKDS